MVTTKPSEKLLDPVEASPAYTAALESSAVLRRRERRFLFLDGKDPRAMLSGILSGHIPGAIEDSEDGWGHGEAPYSAVLTPKGKMVTDLRILPGREEDFFLDLPEIGLEPVLAHFKKYLNPRFARLTDKTEAFGMLTVTGPKGPEYVSSVLGFPVENPGPYRVRYRSGGSGHELWVLGNGEVHPPTFDLILPVAVLEQVRGQMEEGGIRSMDQASWDVLRIEAGTPLFGVDMTDETIPVEAGIHQKAIDYEKGCYTGQEVIIRLRDRGRVNKRLCRLLLGDSRVPERGTEFFLRSSEAEGKVAGWVTSGCRSPRFGQTIALGYVKRGVEMGSEVALDGPDGPHGQVGSLEAEEL